MWITAAALAILLAAEWKGVRPVVWIAKPLASAGFVLAAWNNGGASTRYGLLILVATIFSLAGDVLLIPKRTAAFLGGIAAFLLAHVWFAAAFASRGVQGGRLIAALVLLSVVAVVVHRWLAAHVPVKLRVAVVAYIVTIVAMAAIALASRATWHVPVGAVAFFLSDLAVARERFVTRSFINKLWGLPLYYAAVHILAASIPSAAG